MTEDYCLLRRWVWSIINQNEMVDFEVKRLLFKIPVGQLYVRNISKTIREEIFNVNCTRMKFSIVLQSFVSNHSEKS